MLRNHIPLAGPATREPCDGTEGMFRVSIGFIPRWFHQRLGIDFSEQWHEDPIYRYETLATMKMYLTERFPSVTNFQPRFENGIEPTCATLSGVYGSKLIPMMYGQEVRYFADDWPDNTATSTFSKEHLAALVPIDVAENPVARRLQRQMELIATRFGRIHGYLNYQGILNVALKLRGNDIFTDMVEAPEFVRFLFNHIGETILSTALFVQERQRRSGFPINLLSMSNCVMNMISPKLYERFVLPLDRALSEHFQCFGIHTCNWNATPYFDVLRKIPGLGYIDMGRTSDLTRARELFPAARRAVFYSPLDLKNNAQATIRDDLEDIFRRCAPCDVVMADVTEDTEDTKVVFFLQEAERIAAMPGAT